MRDLHLPYRIQIGIRVGEGGGMKCEGLGGVGSRGLGEGVKGPGGDRDWFLCWVEFCLRHLP